MASVLTADQKADLAWLDGFRARLQGQPRPSGPEKAAGWDDAAELIKVATAHGGGYGP